MGTIIILLYKTPSFSMWTVLIENGPQNLKYNNNNTVDKWYWASCWVANIRRIFSFYHSMGLVPNGLVKHN